MHVLEAENGVRAELEQEIAVVPNAMVIDLDVPPQERSRSTPRSLKILGARIRSKGDT